jgi:hypothetical protein
MSPRADVWAVITGVIIGGIVGGVIVYLVQVF